MRLDSAEVSSDFTFARSVMMKRLETSAAWPKISSVAGTIICSQSALVVIRRKCVPISNATTTAVTASARPALKRGSATIRYAAMNRKMAFSTIQHQVGATKKCSCRMDDTECASVSTGAIAGDTGVTDVEPTPAAVG